MIEYVLPFLVGYFLGCLNLAHVLGASRNVDLRKTGSGNLGASNVAITMGIKSGAAVVCHDVGKAVLAVLAVRCLCPDIPLAGYVAGSAAVIGHVFPVQIGFRGGKGFAAYIGLMLASDPRFCLAWAAAAVILTFLTDYIVAATFSAVITYPIYLMCLRHDPAAAATAAAASVLILARHRENIARIRSGEEHRIRDVMKRNRKS